MRELADISFFESLQSCVGCPVENSLWGRMKRAAAYNLLGVSLLAGSGAWLHSLPDIRALEPALMDYIQREYHAARQHFPNKEALKLLGNYKGALKDMIDEADPQKMMPLVEDGCARVFREYLEKAENARSTRLKGKALLVCRRLLGSDYGPYISEEEVARFKALCEDVGLSPKIPH